MGKHKMPTNAEIRLELSVGTALEKVGIKMPICGTPEFKILLKAVMKMTVPVTCVYRTYDKETMTVTRHKKVVDKVVKDVYSVEQVKRFLTRAGHATNCDATMGKATRGHAYKAEAKPAKRWHTMGEFKARAKGVTKEKDLPSSIKF